MKWNKNNGLGSLKSAAGMTLRSTSRLVSNGRAPPSMLKSGFPLALGLTSCCLPLAFVTATRGGKSASTSDCISLSLLYGALSLPNFWYKACGKLQWPSCHARSWRFGSGIASLSRCFAGLVALWSHHWYTFSWIALMASLPSKIIPQ